MLEIVEKDIGALALGATVLGAGGGGDPWVNTAILAQAIAEYGPIEVVDASQLPATDRVATIGLVGAPTAMLEQFPGPCEVKRSLDLLERVVGAKCAAVMPIEVGGMNALFPLAAAAWAGVPCLDADAMHRAFPHIDMTLPALRGVRAGPAVLAGCSGYDVVLRAPTNRGIESMARGCVRDMGLVAVLCAYPMTSEQCIKTCAQGSLTHCLEIGRQLAAVDPHEPDALDGFLGLVGGRCLVDGAVVHVVRPEVNVRNGRGTVLIEAEESPERLVRIEYQSENIIAIEDGRPLATTPDLIVILRLETLQPVATEAIAVGQRVQVIGIPVHHGWTTAEGIAMAGPRAYGYDLDYSAFESAG
ncbi:MULTISPECIES: DUF917 domain-containing protein [Mycolicibacterium]|uniref:DUF917 domain-containing protein n=1 Tax=Mycolicibacterium TaxID=1866885 RepID=UPI0013FDC357|nr:MULTISPECIES: DUF917 domain-containing protein [Mycolicibacterium]MBU8828274.1 DUF917 domain-containing protein [Mycolicibacterium goodii]MCV7284361.1 DUF917 domain-containing protein [Mycolicibacterium wolinskyi]MCV7294197.1 DUF917 domain-containing protein [Mycolicibacterium goodii]